MYEVGLKVHWQGMNGSIIKMTDRYIYVRFYNMGVGHYKFTYDGLYVGNVTGERLTLVKYEV